MFASDFQDSRIRFLVRDPQRRLYRFNISAHNWKKFFWTNGIPMSINASNETN
jgi:hypothetical protein